MKFKPGKLYKINTEEGILEGYYLCLEEPEETGGSEVWKAEFLSPQGRRETFYFAKGASHCFYSFDDVAEYRSRERLIKVLLGAADFEELKRKAKEIL